MSISQRVESIEAIATVLADTSGAAAWSVEGNRLFLRVVAGKKKWSIAAASEPIGAARDMCANYLLRKMAYAAAVCPSCIAPVSRAARHSSTNKTPKKRYRCSSCMHSWTDS